MTYIPDLNYQAHSHNEAGSEADFEVSVSHGTPVPADGQIVRIDGQAVRVVRSFADPINDGVTVVAIQKL